MFGTGKFYFTFVTALYIKVQLCTAEVESPFLALYSPGEPDYTEVLVHRTGDNLTLVCELKGDPSPRVFVWNYVNDNGTDGGRTFSVSPSGTTHNSTLERTNLQESDSGHYMCSAPPFSVTKYILVQQKGASKCARGALSCGLRCVLATYVCDGRRDCVHAEDELPPLCGPLPCARVDRLNCSTGRCVPEAACCRRSDPLCPQPDCCNEHVRYARLPGSDKDEYPPLFEDRHAPDDGFIQSTIYTVTACALIFMVAVVLLVSALCKMHMKRAALRGYALAHRRARDHYAARYPPRYEAASLLEPALSPLAPPQPQVLSQARYPPRYEAASLLEPALSPLAPPQPQVLSQARYPPRYEAASLLEPALSPQPQVLSQARYPPRYEAASLLEPALSPQPQVLSQARYPPRYEAASLLEPALSPQPQVLSQARYPPRYEAASLLEPALSPQPQVLSQARYPPRYEAASLLEPALSPQPQVLSQARYPPRYEAASLLEPALSPQPQVLSQARYPPRYEAASLLEPALSPQPQVLSQARYPPRYEAASLLEPALSPQPQVLSQARYPPRYEAASLLEPALSPQPQVLSQARYPSRYEAASLLKPALSPQPQVLSQARYEAASLLEPALSPLAPPQPQVLSQARYPPRYEAASLLEPALSPLSPPQRQDPSAAQTPETEEPLTPTSGFGLARLSHIFSRYRQVPTHCDVEMTDVRAASLTSSPARGCQLQEYRSPACCDPDLYLADPDLCPRDLNYTTTPVEFFRRRTLRRNTLDRVMDQLTQAQRPLTLQLGRFQLSIPRFGRRPEEPRPDTPNVAEINIDDLDFVRLNSNETYTLNGRTIHLLGANFENYPVLDNRPPPYNEAMRYKMYGPPPEYLSREGINRSVSYSTNESEARNNIEMPPGYDELASGVNANVNASPAATEDSANNNVEVNTDSARSTNTECNMERNSNNNIEANGNSTPGVSDNNDNVITNNILHRDVSLDNTQVPESIHSVMESLPAIDSDINANETRYVVE